MKKIILNILFLTTMISSVIVAVPKPATKIQELKNFSDLLEIVKDKDTILLLSVDNALLRSPMQMGQRAWFYHRKAMHMKNGLKENLATQKALAEWTGVLNLFGQQAVANDVAKTIDEIQNKRIKVIGISSRGLGLASLTIQHLSQAGIDLGRTSGIKQDVPVILGEKLLLYRNGVLFTSGVGKAMALKRLGELTRISQPKKVVMVSNDERTLKLTAEGIRFHHKNIEFVPLRYSAMDETIKQFNPEIADLQFASMMNVLSDEQAKLKIQKSTESKK